MLKWSAWFVLLCVQVSAQERLVTTFRCTEPLPLTEGFERLRGRHFERAFGWLGMSEQYPPSFMELKVSVGQATGDTSLEAEVADQRGKWRIPLGTESLHPLQLQTLNQLMNDGRLVSPAPQRLAIMKASSSFSIFGSDLETFVTMRPYMPTPPWLDLSVDFKAFASLDHQYAVLLSSNLSRVSVCLPNPEVQGATMKREAVRAAAFRFFAEVNHLDLLTCEGFLSPYPVLF